MNTDWAEAHGFVFKLAYHFSSQEKPVLEIFADSETARAEDWRVYGAHPDAEAAVVQFTRVGDTQAASLRGTTLQIRFDTVTQTEIVYPDTCKETIPLYTFAVEKAD